MKCPHADECPSKSGWCTKPDLHCIDFILTAYSNLQNKHNTMIAKIERLCNQIKKTQP